jgi:hypothetical protein
MKFRILVSATLLSLLIVIQACKKDGNAPSGPTISENTLKDFFTQNGTRNELFTFDSGVQQTLYTNNYWTSFYIPANSFVTLNDQVISGAITLQIKGILNKKDMILNGIFPVSNSLPLISAGEYYIEATKNGERLKLAPNKNIRIDISTNTSPLVGMQVFYASELTSHTNWGTPSSDTVNWYQGAIGPGYYSFDIPQLNWINCDKYEYVTGPKTDLKITLSDPQFKANNTYVFIAFVGDNSAAMLPNYSKGYFTNLNYNLPVGLNATIIAISKIDDQYYSAFKSTTLTANHIDDLNLTPTTMDDFKLQLDSIP